MFVAQSGSVAPLEDLFLLLWALPSLFGSICVSQSAQVLLNCYVIFSMLCTGFPPPLGQCNSTTQPWLIIMLAFCPSFNWEAGKTESLKNAGTKN